MRYYTSVNRYLQQRFGCKVYKVALSGGFTCPNRDGTLGQPRLHFLFPRGQRATLPVILHSR